MHRKIAAQTCRGTGKIGVSGTVMDRVRPPRRWPVPRKKSTSRGASKRGKFKPGKNRKGQGKRNMKRLSVRKDQNRD